MTETTLMGIRGRMTLDVRPAYVGVCNLVAEPIDDPVYERGQIWWRLEDDRIVGHARIVCPPGLYITFLWFRHPRQPWFAGQTPMPHSLHLTRPINVIDVDPITEELIGRNR